jgi:hypothetical protein
MLPVNVMVCGLALFMTDVKPLSALLSQRTCRRVFRFWIDQLSAIKRLYKRFKFDEERFPPSEANAVVHLAVAREGSQRANMVDVRDDETRKKVEIYQLYEGNASAAWSILAS